MRTASFPAQGYRLHRYNRHLGTMLTVVALMLLACVVASAQPSDARIRKDLTGPKTIAITLPGKTGTRQWNGSLGAYEYVRRAICTLRTDDPKVKLLVTGDAVYQMNGTKATYWKFRVGANEYLGLPNPTTETIMEMIEGDISTFFGSTYNNMVGDDPRITMASKPEWTWHRPTSVEFSMVAEYWEIANTTTVQKIRNDYRVRLYRDSPDAPWKSLHASSRLRTVVEEMVYTAEQISAMQKLIDMNSRE